MGADPVVEALAVLHEWEEGARELVAAGPFAGGGADWTTVQGKVFHEGLLPALILVRAGPESASYPLERKSELAAAAALGRPARRLEGGGGAPLAGWRIRLAALARALAGLAAGGRREAPAVAALCQDVQRGAEGDDPFWSGLLPPGSVRILHTVSGRKRDGAAGVPFEPFLLRGLFPGMAAFRRRWGRWLRREARELARRLRCPGLPPDRGVEAAWLDLIRQGVHHSVLFRLGAEALLRRLRPGTLLCYTEFSPPAYQLLRAARAAGARTVAVQHGDLVDGLSAGMLHSPLERVEAPDATCVFGDAYREILAAAGLHAGRRVAVTGHLWRGLARRRPRPDPAGPVLLLSQSFLGAACRAAFFASVRQIRETDLRVKLHPYERWGLPAGWLPPGARVVPGGLPLFAALEGVSVVAGASSSGLLEALHLGFPVVSIASPVERIRHDALRGCFLEVAAGEDPGPAIAAARRFRPDPAGERALAGFLRPDPSPAAFLEVLAGHGA